MIYFSYLGSAGLTDVGYEFFNAASASLGARSEANVLDRGEAWYSADIVPPANAVEIRWDSISTGDKAREALIGIGAPTTAQIRDELDNNSVKLGVIAAEVVKVPRVGFVTRWRNLGCTADTDLIGIENP